MQRLKSLVLWPVVLTLLPALAGRNETLGSAPEEIFRVQSWDTEPAAGMFLVAQRGLDDPFFGRSVILLLSHSVVGSQGLIVNHQSRWRLSDVLAGIDGTQADAYPLFFGGPLGVHRVFMLMHGVQAVPSARHVIDDIYFSDSRQTLDDMLASKTPASQLHFYVGYASWTTGQLAVELARGSWHLVEADSGAVFGAASDDLWERMINTLEPDGIEVRLGPLQPCCPAVHTAGSI